MINLLSYSFQNNDKDIVMHVHFCLIRPRSSKFLVCRHVNKGIAAIMMNTQTAYNTKAPTVWMPQC